MSEHQTYLIITLLAIIAGNGMEAGWLRWYIYVTAGTSYLIAILSTDFARGFIRGLTGWNL